MKWFLLEGFTNAVDWLYDKTFGVMGRTIVRAWRWEPKSVRRRRRREAGENALWAEGAIDIREDEELVHADDLR